MRLTKIDVAEAHLVTAVRGTFRGEHPASIYLLAASAREILTTIGIKTNVRTALHVLSEETGYKLSRLKEAAHQFAGFMKHADKDADAALDRFTAADADILLFIACNDFGIIANGKPIELQVYEAWWLATAHESISKAPLRSQHLIRGCIQLFPGIRRANRAARQALGLTALEKARLDDTLIMAIDREVHLP
jgi:hypothetical protein